MATIRNISGSDLEVPGHGLVEADTVIDVPDASVESYVCQEATWDTVGYVADDEDDE